MDFLKYLLSDVLCVFMASSCQNEEFGAPTVYSDSE